MPANALVQQRSWSRLERFIGKTPFQRALRMRQQRFGRNVSTAVVPRKPAADAAIAKSLERHEQKVLEWRSRKKTPKTIAVLEARAAVLRGLRQVGFKPNFNNLVAALAYEHGLKGGSESKLLKAMNAANTMNLKLGGTLASGSMGLTHTAIKRDLCFKINEVLASSKEALNTKEIAVRIGLKPTWKQTRYVTTALGILDLMGLSYKLPSAKGGLLYRWIHAARRMSSETIPVWSIDFITLKKLSERNAPAAATELSREIGVSNLRKTLRRLERLQLIKTTLASSRTMVALSSYGKTLIREQAEINYFHPRLRIALLDLPRPKNEPSPLEFHRRERFERWGRAAYALRLELSTGIRRKRGGDYGTRGFAGVKIAARRIGENRKFMEGVALGKTPFHEIPPSKLLSFYVPWIKRTNPRAAMMIEEYALNAQRALPKPARLT